MTYKQLLERNIKLFYPMAFFSALLFNIPIWVAYKLRVMDFTQIALLNSLVAVITIALELPTGALADLIGRKKTVIVGWMFMIGASLVQSFANSFDFFFWAAILMGIGGAFISGSDIALVFDSLKELGREEQYSSFNAKASSLYRLALVIGSLLGGYLYSIWIGLPYLIMAVAQVFVVLFYLFMKEPKIDSEKFSFKNYLDQNRQGFKQLVQSAYMKKLAVYYLFVAGITWSALEYFNQPFAYDIGFSGIEQSWLFAGVYLISSALLVFLLDIRKVLSRNIVYLGFPILMIISFSPAVLANKTTAPLMLLGIMFAGSARFSVLDRYVNKEVLSKYRATTLSTLNMMVGIMFALIVGIGGYFQEAFNTKIIFSFMGVASLVFILPIGLSLIKERRLYLEKKYYK